MPLITPCAVIVEVVSPSSVSQTMADIHMRLSRLEMRPSSLNSMILDDGKVVFELVFRTEDEARRFDNDF
jgi:hypothetical protein